MTAEPGVIEIGRVLRASTAGFTCGTRSPEINYPSFGAFVYTTHSNGDNELHVIGVITGIHIEDDPLVRQLIMASNMNEAALRDQRENRMVPVEIEVLNTGFFHADQPYYHLPPRPPLSLDPVFICDDATVALFTEKLDFLRLILSAGNVPATDLTGAVIQEAALARPAALRHEFLVSAGRRLAGLLSHDLVMLREILKLIHP